jgi:hypothetical protein
MRGRFRGTGLVLVQTSTPNSDRPLRISIGNIPFSLFIPEELLLQQALKRYSEFTAESTAGLPVSLKPREQEEQEPGSFSYDLDGASVILRGAGAEFRGVRHEYALDSLLRILLTMVLLPKRGFLLHAATVVRDGRAYVFAGRSGAGKSTVASLSPEGSVLTDEISLLRFTNGCWQAHGTPFWGEFRAAGRNDHFPLAGIYSLVQAPEDRVEAISNKEILRALLPCVLFFNSETGANEALLHTLLGLVEQVSCQRLHFRRSAEFWNVVAA